MDALLGWEVEVGVRASPSLANLEKATKIYLAFQRCDRTRGLCI